MGFGILGAAVDLVHALAMAAWALGLPLLLWHRWPRLTRAYCYYSIFFVAVLLVSQAALGECVLTTLSRAFWQRAQPEGAQASGEWFTVRLAQAIFDLTPSHLAVKRASEVLSALTAVGVLVSLRRLRQNAPARARPTRPGSATGRALTPLP